MKRIGILASGGDAPGMNAAVRAVARIATANGIEVFGIRCGFVRLVAGDTFPMISDSVANILTRGGTFPYTARCPEFAQEEGRLCGIGQLKKHGIEVLVVIGGDGSYHDALALTKRGLNSVGLPGIIDNDIPFTDLTIGFDIAHITAADAIDKIRDTASSHQRVFVINATSHGCGDITMRVGVANGADAIAIPEKPYDIEAIANELKKSSVNGRDHGIVVIAEGVMPSEDFLKELLKYGDFDTHTEVLGHVQRGGEPTVSDRILASKMGSYTVKLLMEGKGGLAVGIGDNYLCTHDIVDLFDSRHVGDYSLLAMNGDLPWQILFL